MSKRRQKTSWKLQVSTDGLAAIASQVFNGHATLNADGYRLQGSSGLWRRRNGTLTARLVYRHPDPRGIPCTMVVTVKGIQITEAQAA